MIVGIDIGTSYSSICVLGSDGKKIPVDISTGISVYGSKYSMPSAVFVDEKGNVLLGQSAMNSRIRLPQNFRMEFKRELGQDIPVILGPRKFLVRELYTEMYRYMTRKAEQAHGEPIEKAILTYPASYGTKKRQQIQDAAKAAGLFQTELVDEPTAAAMSFCEGNDLRDGEVFLVYDFGGGTFDVSLVEYKDGKFGVLGRPDGLENCGGIDIDRKIYQDMVGKLDKEMLSSVSRNPLNRMRLDSQLAELAVKAKHHLSTADYFEEDIQVGFELIPYELSRENLEGMISPMVRETVEVCDRALKVVGLKRTDLSAVFMVGGTSRVPLVRAQVEKWANGVRVLSAADLELAVAAGAVNASPQKRKHENLRLADIRILEQLAGEENVDACYELGCRYAFGNGIDINLQEAMRWFEKAAAQGCGAAMSDLGIIWSRRLDAKKDIEGAVKWYTKAAIAGDAAGQYYLGEIYHTGDGVEKDEEIAQQWMNRGLKGLKVVAEEGDAEAAMLLAAIYKGDRGTPKDEEKSKKYTQKAVKLYTERAERGEAHTQFSLGLLYEELLSDRSKARYWLQKSAENNHVFAQFVLGDTYPHEDDSHFKWMRKAAEHGHIVAQWWLGKCHAEGKGVSKNLSQAFYWYEKAANMGKNTQIGTCAMAALVELKKQVTVSLVKAYISQKTFITKGSGEFTEKQIGNLKRVLQVPAAETVILARDSTVFESGKNGYILTDYGIHSKGAFCSVYHVSWGDFIRGKIKVKELSKGVKYGIDLNGDHICMHCSGLDNEMADFWPRLQEYLRRQLRCTFGYSAY